MEKLTNENYVDLAEKVIKSLDDAKNDRGYKIKTVTTSQIRNLLAMTANIYNEVMLLRQEQLDEDLKGKISYLRVRCLYEAGREESIKVFVQNSSMLEILPTIKTKKDYILFNHYMESLIAWHKYCHGKDS